MERSAGDGRAEFDPRWLHARSHRSNGFKFSGCGLSSRTPRESQVRRPTSCCHRLHQRDWIIMGNSECQIISRASRLCRARGLLSRVSSSSRTPAASPPHCCHRFSLQYHHRYFYYFNYAITVS